MKNFKMTRIAAACLLAGSINSAFAAEPARISSDDLLNILIQQGVIDEKKVDEVIKRAQDKTRQQYQSGVETVPAVKADNKPAQDGSVVRVPYVPQYIKDEIRDKVRTELREEVVADVMKKAEQERWGLPGTAPDWTQRIKFSGDVRLRAESIMFAEGNEQLDYPDYMKINKSQKETGQYDRLNLTEDRHRLRARARVGMKAKVTQGMEAGVRIATGATSNPVSTNETLGDYGRSYDAQLDRGYLKYNTFAEDITAVGGRFENPFYRTDLIWDNDLQFEGVAGSWYWLRSSSWDSEDRQWDPFVTVGLFPIDEYELSGEDKWMVGAQTGFTYQSWSQNEWKFGIGYFQYENMPGVENPVNQNATDFTAPDYIQKGNSYFDILNPDPASGESRLYALAYDYTIVDVLMEYDIAAFSPHHVILTAEYLQNIAGDKEEASQRAGEPVEVEGFDGFLLKAAFGWPIVAKPDDWQVAVTYRNLGANAVVDGFADSDFHLGGTDSRGYIIEGSYGLLAETWVTVKWMSSDQVDQAILGVDILQVDLNARF